MSKPSWTVDQQTAIDSTGNILVNAAAGSGKTAVLVERIIKKLLPDENGKYIRAENLLVVTFARDAAREMQQRIKKSLSKKLEKETDSQIKLIIREQLKSVAIADITTIDSFCMKIIKENCHLLGIDSRFKISDPTDSEIKKLEELDEFITMQYEKNSEEFKLCMNTYCHNYDEILLKKMIAEIHSFICSTGDPKEWLRQAEENYNNFKGNLYEQYYIDEIREAARDILIKYEEMIDDFSLYFIEEKYDESFYDELLEFDKKDVFKTLVDEKNALSEINIKDFDSLIELVDGRFGKISKVGIRSSDKEEFIKNLIDRRENCAGDLRISDELLSGRDTIEAAFNDSVKPVVHAICTLTSEFYDFYLSRKIKNKELEFNDLEHLSVEILTKFPDIAKEMRDKYEEILIDEFQDTNGLQMAIFNYISRENNTFVVGDIKQCIYQFRQSDPLIFKNRDMLYHLNPDKGLRVILSKNFRSRREVLDSINDIFKQIMCEKVGEVTYDDEQALHVGNMDYEKIKSSSDYRSEIYVLENSKNAEENDESDTVVEARFIAQKINQMIQDEFLVTENGKLRPVKTDDFAILLNAVKSTSDIYIKELKRFDIPSYSECVGFYSRSEIILISELLTVIDNPYNDISLLSVMRSPVFRFSDDELCQIRLNSIGYFYDAVCKTSEGYNETAVKCKSFVDSISGFREMSEYMTADRLILNIYSKTSLYDMSGILYGGDEAQANLMLFSEKAKVFSSLGTGSLFDFVQYINKAKQNDKVSPANTNHDGIPIMTIHKSKGLEFPVVFVAGVGKKFYSAPNNSGVYLHNKYGMGLRVYNEKHNAFFGNSAIDVISELKRTEEQSEQLRKLYVAMTRAREKLIVVGTVEPAKATDESNSEFSKKVELLKKKDITTARGKRKLKSFLEFILPAVFNAKDTWIYNQVCYSGADGEETQGDENENEETDNTILMEQVDILMDKLYNTEYIKPMPVKTTVTELKNKGNSKFTQMNVPSFIKSSKTRGAEHGTEIHKIMEKLDLEKATNINYINKLIEKISGAEDEASAKKIHAFVMSELGQRMSNAQTFRESPFEIPIPSSELTGETDDETILLQGVIDCYFVENEEIVLVDYKTDTAKSENELVDKYSKQLKWYKTALQNLTGKNVRETYIYSFCLESAISVE